MDMRVPQARRNPLAKLIAWCVLLLGVIGAVMGIAELNVVYTVYALIVVALAGMFLLKQKELASTRVERRRDLFTGR